MKVKICGIKTTRELDMCVRAGADAVGFICGTTHRSEDEISPDMVRVLARRLPPFMDSVLVTHLTSASEILVLVGKTRTTALQLQGDIPPHELEVIRRTFPYLKIIKAIHIQKGRSKEAMRLVKKYEDAVDAFLLDTKTHDRLGGTGKVHDWDTSAKVARATSRPVILAGGLDPANVCRAVIKVKPYGVDANSRLKGRDGYKDEGRVRRFVYRAKRCGWSC